MRWVSCPVDVTQGGPTPRMGHIAAVVEGNGAWQESLLIFHGGLSEDKVALQDLGVLQLGCGSWLRPQPVKPGPPARSFHSGAALSSSLYIFGGHVWQRDTREIRKFNDLWRLDTESWSWEKIEPQKASRTPPPRDFASMLALDGSRLLLYGGLDPADRRLDDIWLFDEAKGAWTELQIAGTRPKARYGHSMARMGSRLLMMGGDIGTGYAADLWTLRGMEVGSEEAPAWIQLDLPGPAPSPRKGHCLAAHGPMLVVMGGRMLDTGWFRSRAGAFLNDVVVMGREADDQRVAWQQPHLSSPAPVPREFHTLTQLPFNRFLLFGGGSGKQVFGDAWYLELDGDGTEPQGLSLGSSDAGSSPRQHHTVHNAVHNAPGFSRPQASSRPHSAREPWWAGSRDAAAFEALRRQLGLEASSRKQPSPNYRGHPWAGAEKSHAAASHALFENPPDHQDVRLQDVGRVAELHASLCQQQARDSMVRLKQSAAVTIIDLANCLGEIDSNAHVSPADLQLAHVNQMMAELQQQVVA